MDILNAVPLSAKKNGSKHLVFDSADENKEVLKKYKTLGCDLKWNWNNKWQ